MEVWRALAAERCKGARKQGVLVTDNKLREDLLDVRVVAEQRHVCEEASTFPVRDALHRRWGLSRNKHVPLRVALKNADRRLV